MQRILAPLLVAWICGIGGIAAAAELTLFEDDNLSGRRISDDYPYNQPPNWGRP